MTQTSQQPQSQGAASFSQDEFSALLNKEFRPKSDQARAEIGRAHV